MLGREGFDVIEAADGETMVWPRTTAAEADIVLLDLMMPGLPGTEVCRRLRQRGSVPVIMVTACDSESTRSWAGTRGRRLRHQTL